MRAKTNIPHQRKFIYCAATFFCVIWKEKLPHFYNITKFYKVYKIFKDVRRKLLRFLQDIKMVVKDVEKNKSTLKVGLGLEKTNCQSENGKFIQSVDC